MAAKVKLFSDPANRAWAASASPCMILYRGHLFWCAEQLAKFKQSKSKEYREKILTAYTLKAVVYLTKPSTMQEMGFAMDPAYDKSAAMLRAQREKYKQNPVAAQMLLATGDAKLSYDAIYDDFFGTGRNGTGEDRMATILTRIRSELRSGKLQVVTVEPSEEAVAVKSTKRLKMKTEVADKKPARKPERKSTGKKVVKKKTRSD